MTSIIDDYAAIAKLMKGELKPEAKLKAQAIKEQIDAAWRKLNQDVPVSSSEPTTHTLIIRCTACHGVGIDNRGNRCTGCSGRGGIPCPGA